MAVSNQISLLVDLYKNMMTTSKGYGMIYGRVFSRKGLNLKGFARHVSDHGGLVKYDLMVLVIQNIVECLKELLVQGVPVKLDGLGTFSIGIKSKGANSYLAYDLGKHVKNIRLSVTATGDFTRAELNKAGELAYTSLAESLRNAERPQPEPEPDGDDDDNNNG